jgi:vesicle coat complex subunit
MRKIVLVFLSGLLIGCSGKPGADGRRPPVQAEVGQAPNLYAIKQQGAGFTPWNPGGAGEQSAAFYQGLNAAQWAEQIQHPEPDVQRQAFRALSELKNEGYPHLMSALNHRSAEVRLQALQAIQLPMLVDARNQEKTVPMLIRLLQDPDPVVRQEAAARLAWFDQTPEGDRQQAGFQAQERLRALQFALNDPNPSVRDAADFSLKCVQGALSGKVASD